MKKVKYLAMLLAAGMFAACSDNLEDAGAGNSGGIEFEGETGYVNISLNLPTTSGNSSRANDVFDDGLAAEYNVNDAIIALFYGTDEATATCKNAFQLTEGDFQLTGSTTDNITSYYASGVRMIEAPTEGQNVYALAILNCSGIFAIEGPAKEGESTGDAVLTTTLKLNNVVQTGKKLSDLWTEAAYDAKIASTSDKGNFLMTNAPIASASSFAKGSKPSDFKVTTLAPITIYNSKEIASGVASANPIYVERAVAKTTVKVNSENGTLTVESEVPAYDGATVKFNGWKLQNTNKKYYYVRKVTDETIADWEDWVGYFNNESNTSEINRFFGQIANPYRTYWGIDPNYDLVATDKISDNFNIYDNETNVLKPTDWNSVGNKTTDAYTGKYVEYCAENTTKAQAMQHDNLTGVLLEATFTPKGATEGTDFFRINNTSAIYNETEFLTVALDALLDVADENKLQEGEKLVRNATVKPFRGSTITDIQGIKNLIQVEVTGESTTTKALTDNQANAILTAMGKNVKYYQGGVSYYYATLIDHFGETQASLGENSISNLTDYVEAQHLGRWGVLRNNWYELNIIKVSGPGEPDVPEIPTDPADKTNSYINCQINVLSWAKRAQDVEL